MGRVPPVGDGDDEEALDVRLVQPFQARKAYLCPGCLKDIAVGVAHFVVVPLAAPDERRHWHKACWQHRATRKPPRR